MGVSMRELVARMIGPILRRYRHRIVGHPSSPSRFARFAGSVVSRLPGERYPVLKCQGPLDGYRMRVDWNHYRSFVYGTWEPDVVRAIQKSVGPGQVALDIGAAFGFYTLLLAKLVGSTGLVFSFEPMGETRAVLQTNVGLNSLRQVTVVGDAVADYEGELEMYLTSDGDLLHSTSVDAQVGNAGPAACVPCVSLDAFWQDKKMPIHFIKLDVEGAEEKVLLGASAVIKTYRPNMLIELHGVGHYRGKHPALRILKEWRYEVQQLEKNRMTSHIYCQPTRVEVAG
jgi:FkbM family methyltransferase